MGDKITTVAVTALAITGIGIALRPNAPTASVLKALLGGFAGIQTAAFGPKG